jgi:hypothetical protein
MQLEPDIVAEAARIGQRSQEFYMARHPGIERISGFGILPVIGLNQSVIGLMPINKRQHIDRQHALADKVHINDSAGIGQPTGTGQAIGVLESDELHGNFGFWIWDCGAKSAIANP